GDGVTAWALLPAAWAVVVAGAAWRRRPTPRRVRVLLSVQSRARRARRVPSAERLGGAVLRLLRRDADPVAARRVGLAAVAAMPMLVLLPVAAPAAAVAAWCWPTLEATRAEKRRLAARAAAVPAVLDLSLLA